MIIILLTASRIFIRCNKTGDSVMLFKQSKQKKAPENGAFYLKLIT